MPPPIPYLRLVAEYIEFAPASLVADAAESLSGDPLLHMVHTRDGVAAACAVLAYGTAKDRKKAVRAMKVLGLQKPGLYFVSLGPMVDRGQQNQSSSISFLGGIKTSHPPMLP
jgi:hypothetical protein